jgi:hypothetical protein
MKRRCAKGNKAELPRGSSDAALMPYRVDRSKLFVMDRVAKIVLFVMHNTAAAFSCDARHSASGQSKLM